MDDPPASRRLRAAWMLWLAALACLWAAAWLWPAWHHGLAQRIQGWYGVPFASAPWYLRGNMPLHAMSTALATWCLIAGARLHAPRWSAWWAVAAVAAIAVADELLQLASARRGFDVREWQSDAAGLALGVVGWLAWRQWRSWRSRSGNAPLGPSGPRQRAGPPR